MCKERLIDLSDNSICCYTCETLWLLGGGWKVLRVDVCQKQKVQVSDQLFAETSLSRPFGEIKVLALKVEIKRST